MNFILNLFGIKSIRSEIMSVLNNKISQAEKNFKAGIKAIRTNTEFKIFEAIEEGDYQERILLDDTVKDVLANLTK